jgi:putative tryptophan/tyrosine transport system substrate-binding protein
VFLAARLTVHFPGAEPAFIQGLKATGFLEGENISIEWRWAEGQYNRLSSEAAELVDRNVAVIVAFDVPAAFAAKAATKNTPIVFLAGADPVRLALLDSLNQPHGNLTGVSHLINSLEPKQLELLHELVQNFRRAAYLVNPSNRNSRIDTPEVQAAADALGQHLEVLTAGTENELDAAFAKMARQQIDALVVKADPFFISQHERLVALAARYAVPAIYPLPEFVKVGGLMSYGGNMADAYRQEGTYTGRILKGAKAADLPISNRAPSSSCR